MSSGTGGRLRVPGVPNAVGEAEGRGGVTKSAQRRTCETAGAHPAPALHPVHSGQRQRCRAPALSGCAVRPQLLGGGGSPSPPQHHPQGCTRSHEAGAGCRAGSLDQPSATLGPGEGSIAGGGRGRSSGPRGRRWSRGRGRSGCPGPEGTAGERSSALRVRALGSAWSEVPGTTAVRALLVRARELQPSTVRGLGAWRCSEPFWVLQKSLQSAAEPDPRPPLREATKFRGPARHTGSAAPAAPIAPAVPAAPTVLAAPIVPAVPIVPAAVTAPAAPAAPAAPTACSLQGRGWGRPMESPRRPHAPSCPHPAPHLPTAGQEAHLCRSAGRARWFAAPLVRWGFSSITGLAAISAAASLPRRPACEHFAGAGRSPQLASPVQEHRRAAPPPWCAASSVWPRR